eukprot:7022877-Prymnesium_polylepis.1
MAPSSTSSRRSRGRCAATNGRLAPYRRAAAAAPESASRGGASTAAASSLAASPHQLPSPPAGPATGDARRRFVRLPLLGAVLARSRRADYQPDRGARRIECRRRHAAITAITMTTAAAPRPPQVFRQSDTRFVDLLNEMRRGALSPFHVSQL